MNLPFPVKIKLVGMVKPNVLIKVLATEEFIEMNPNEFVRRIEEGKYELVEANVKSRSNAFAAPAP
jgi:hypothetical protein